MTSRGRSSRLAGGEAETAIRGKTVKRLRIPALFALALLASCGSDTKTVEREMEGAAQAPLSKAAARLMEGVDPGLELVTTATGLQFVDVVEGGGERAEVGRKVRVKYTGWLLDGAKFDSSVDRGRPLEFALGSGRVIPGWDEGIAGMKVGGRRRLALPPELGYGERGIGPIPPNSTLIFEVELLGVQ